MQRWLGKSLKRKLSVILLGSILVPLLSLGYVLYTIAALEAEEKAKQSSMSILRQIDTNLEFIIQDVENMSIFLIGQEDIQQYLAKPNQNGSLQIKIMGFLSNLVFSKKYISDISIYPNNRNHSLSNTTIFQNGLSLTPTHPVNTQPGTKWWTSLYENVTTTGEEKVISLLRPIGSMTTYRPKGILSISIHESAIADFILKPGIDGDGYVLLLDQEGKIISGGQRDYLTQPVTKLFPNLSGMDDPRGFMNYGSGAAKKTIVYYKVPNVNWTLMAVIPFEQYQAQNRYVLSITALAVGLAMLIIAAFVLFFVQRVTKPLQSLAHSLKDFQPDDDVVAIRVTSSDEVGLLIHSYNKLGERIQRLMNQVQRNEALKKEADMQALQAQINPHFLYNTLASIHWMALMNQDPKIAEMVGSLSDFLRFSLNRGHEYCHVKQEMEHARHYASIQNIRYPNQFEIEFIIDAAIESKWMLKLLLQPLIENAIIHGIMQQQDNGYISVRAQPLNEGWMHFTVEDSGKGLTTEQLQLIRQRLEAPMDQHAGPQGSYGLRNVHQRLQLHYGQDTGLTIESIAGHGTQVSFSIPYKEDLI